MKTSRGHVQVRQEARDPQTIQYRVAPSLFGMGTIHQLRLEQLRRRFSANLQPRRFLRPSDIGLFFGVLVISAAIGAKAIGLWHEPGSPHSQPVAGVRVIDGDSLTTND